MATKGRGLGTPSGAQCCPQPQISGHEKSTKFSAESTAAEHCCFTVDVKLTAFQHHLQSNVGRKWPKGGKKSQNL